MIFSTKESKILHQNGFTLHISLINKVLQLCHKENIIPKLNTLKEKDSFTEKYAICKKAKKQKLVNLKVNIKIYIRGLLDFFN